MTAKRRYRLQCPIARALDIVGDRWALLILRDLHAGPARFQQLESGLGIASNLLTTRLHELSDAGLVQRSGIGARAGYELTETGQATDRVLWELTRFGGLLEREADPREPGNLRTITLPLRMMLETVTDRPDLRVDLRVDDERVAIESNAEAVTVIYDHSPDEPDLVVQTDYASLLDVSEGLIGLEDFATHHVEIVDGIEHAPTFLAFMAAGMTETG